MIKIKNAQDEMSKQLSISEADFGERLMNGYATLTSTLEEMMAEAGISEAD